MTIINAYGHKMNEEKDMDNDWNEFLKNSEEFDKDETYQQEIHDHRKIFDETEKNQRRDNDRILGDWCRDFVETLVKERNRSFGSWATELCIFVTPNPNRISLREFLDNVDSLDKKDYVIDYYYPKNKNGKTEDFYFTLTQSESNIFAKANSGILLDQIRFLVLLSSILSKNKRETDSLELNWVHSQILIHTPNLKFKSKKEINLLKSKIAAIANDLKNQEILNRFQNLIDHKSELVGGEAHKDITPIKSNKPAEVIRSIRMDIQNFNRLYKNREFIGDINLWINYIFLDVPGFSLNHIQKASQRSK